MTQKVLPHQARVDLGVMAMKGYSTIFKSPASLEPHHQIVLCHIQDTRLGVTLLQICSWYILQPISEWATFNIEVPKRKY